jgi:hypothetical protein
MGRPENKKRRYMMQYRKKPVVIDAQCWLGTAETAVSIVNWILDSGGEAYYVVDPIAARPYIAIETLEGVMRASVGDWIIRGVQGEFYPCKPDVFEATYEPANPQNESIEP